MTHSESAGITVAGTTYVPATHMGFARYGYLMSRVWELDLDGIPSDAALMARVFERDLAGAFLAGFLVPTEDGVPQRWTGKAAVKMAQAFDPSVDETAMNQLLLMLVGMLRSFFLGVAGSSGNSATSSDSTATTPVSTSEAPTNEPKDETPSASLASSSEPLAATK